MNKVLAGSLLFVGLYNLLFYPTVVGIGFGVLFALLHLYLYFVRVDSPKNLSFAISLSALSVFFAASIGWRANEGVQVIDLLLAMFLSIAAAFFYKKQDIFSWGVISFLLVPFSAFVNYIKSAYDFFTQNTLTHHTENNKAVYSAVLRGIVIAVPILFILYKLLSGADPIFASLFGNFTVSLSWQVVVSVFLFALTFFWGLVPAVKNAIPKTYETVAGNQSVAIETLVVTVGAAVLFGIFLSVQVQYLFLQVPETQLQHLGINIKTYSEYVRQGFFQLLIAGAIATGIIAYGLQTVHTILQKRGFYLKVGMILLSLETEFLLLSAAKRLYLYTDAHGLTRSRIFGTVFLVWLAVLLVIMIAAAAKNIKRMQFFVAAFIVTMLAFISINIISVDSLIATYYPPTINKEIDYMYIARLSPEAVSSWSPYIQKAQEQWKGLSATHLPGIEDTRKIDILNYSLGDIEDTVFYLDRKYTADPKKYIVSRKDTDIARGWQAFNLSEYQAYLFIVQNREVFEKLQPLRSSIIERKKQWSELQFKETQMNQRVQH